MAILTRVVKLLMAEIHGMIDQMEDRPLLLRQHLRDMEDVLDREKERLTKMFASRMQTRQEHDTSQREIEKLEQDLAVAIHRGRDDIARMLIGKMKPLERLRDTLEGHIGILDREAAQSENCLNQRRLQYEQLKHRSTGYFNRLDQQGWEKRMPKADKHDLAGDPSEEEVEWELLKRKERLKTCHGDTPVK